MDLTDQAAAESSYRNIISHTHDSLAGMLPISNFQKITISNVEIETGLPCLDRDNCICLARPLSYTIKTSPPITYYTYGGAGLNLAELGEDMVAKNNAANCQLIHTYTQSEISRYDAAVVVEIYYTHHQLFRFPGLHLIDPIPLYTKTIMRRVSGRE